MALPKDFKFSHIPAVQAEAERRAGVMFGVNWKELCALKYEGDDTCIAANNKRLEFRDDCLSASTGDWLHDLDDGSPAHISYWDTGITAATAHYFEDAPVDQPDGTPARIDYFENGEICGGYSFSRGSLDPAEVIAMVESARLRRCEAVLSTVETKIHAAGIPPSAYKNPAA